MHVEQERRGEMQKRAYSSRQKKKWMLQSFFVSYVLAGHVMWLSITEINRRAGEKFIIVVEGKTTSSKSSFFFLI